MFKKLLFIAVFFILFLFPPDSYAEGEFATSIQADYKLNEKGETGVTQTISLENLTTDFYAASYSFSLSGVKPEDIIVRESNQAIPFLIEEKDGSFTIKLNFNNPLVGKGKKRIFEIIYKDPSIATKIGEVWEISIPRFSGIDSLSSYKLTLGIPSVLGKNAYIDPKPTSSFDSAGFQYFIFDKKQINESSISAAFGEFQVFSFDLTYHLINPLAQQAVINIAVPPDTAFQKVNFQVFSHEPQKIFIDEDGNWLAEYKLSAKEKVDINIKGAVQLFPKARTFPKPDSLYLDRNREPSLYWQTTDLEIVELAKKYKTPKEIYNFVVNYLTYDYSRVKQNIERFGAKKAFLNPKESVCMEFTDLFIAIARAAGIPAREINGFAYSEDPRLLPLSLVADVLHAWPEYYDSQKGIWVPVDPTWGATSGGEDFFSKLDLRHFTFVIHGLDPVKPYSPGSYKLGANPQKDVFVSPGKLPSLRVSRPQIFLDTLNTTPLFNMGYKVRITNPGTVALYDQPISIYLNDSIFLKDNLSILPPRGIKEFEIKIPYSFLGWNLPDNIVVVVGEERVKFPTLKSQIIITNLSLILLIIFLVFVTIYFKIRVSKNGNKKNLLTTKRFAKKSS